MGEAWSDAVPAILIGMTAVTAPGLIVMLAGWRPRLRFLLLSPAVSLAILAVAAVLAPLVGLTWSPLPVAGVTILAATVAFLLRRWADRGDEPADTSTQLWAAAGGLAAAAAVLALQFTHAFGAPGNISQTFDAIIHLNTIAYAVESTDASAFSIGATSDIPFYPNGWHSLASLVAIVGNVSVPVAVNAANIAVGVLVWPASVVAAAAAFFDSRPTALVASAALSTGFGAFPLLLFNFGVLYPNAVAYAMLPAAMSAVWLVTKTTTTPDRMRQGLLVLVVVAGLGLAHPNAFLALYALMVPTLLLWLLLEAIRRKKRSFWVQAWIAAVVLLSAGAILWRFSRTGWEMSRWSPWETTAQALGEALLGAPRSLPVTFGVAALLALGLVAIIRRPRAAVFGVPFAVASLMFVLAAGTSVDTLLREMITNPWYNDPNRLAALLPIGAIPVATMGAMWLVDQVHARSSRWALPPSLRVAAAATAGAALFLVAMGPNVQTMVAETRHYYELRDDASLLTTDEYRVLSRLSESTPSDALIAGSPWTGTSLAYALAGRDVVELHVFGARSDEEEFLDAHLRDIDEDPRVCRAIEHLGIDFILDFGTQNVWHRPEASADWDGIQGIPPSEHLTLVDAEGDARLLEVTGCAP